MSASMHRRELPLREPVKGSEDSNRERTHPDRGHTTLDHSGGDDQLPFLQTSYLRRRTVPQ